MRLGLGAQSAVVQEARQQGQPEQEKFGAEAGLWDSCEVLAQLSLEVGHSCSAVRAECMSPSVHYQQLLSWFKCVWMWLGLGAQSVVVSRSEAAGAARARKVWC
jgi:hypothetical protein